MLPLRALGLLFGVLLLSSCSGTSPSGSSGGSPATDSTQAERLLARIEVTPDSLATVPRPLFYQSASPLSTDPLFRGWTPVPISPVAVYGWTSSGGNRSDPASDDLPSPTNEVSSAQIQIEAIGGIIDSTAQMGLRIHTTMSDPESLRAFPFVDLFGTQMMIRRGQAWRTLRQEGDSLSEERFVPLSAPDLQRLIQADTAALAVNQAHVRLPSRVQDELASMYTAVPDSLSVDTARVTNRLTVFHSPDSPPQFDGGVSALGDVVGYPEAARKRGLDGTVRIGFVVHPDGSTSHLQIEQDAHPFLNEVVVRIAREADLKPATFQGRPVPVWTTLPVVFRLE